MPSVFESVTGLLAQGETLGRLGDMMGTDRSGAEQVVRSATPAMLGGLADRVDRPGGSRAVMDMLDQAERSPLGDVDGMFDGAAEQGLGLGMLDGIFGKDLGPVQGMIANNSGVSAGVIGRFLPMLAPVVMGVLARRRAADGLDAAGLSGLLRNERDGLEAGGLLGAAGLGAAGLGAAAGAGAVGTRQAVGNGRSTAQRATGDRTTLQETPRPADPNRGRFRWLYWLLAGLAGLLILGWALSQCGVNDVDDTVGAAGDLADDATDAAGDLADDATDAADDLVDDATDAADDLVDDVIDPTDDVASVLAAGDYGDVTADVSDGDVTLNGTVESEDAKATLGAAMMEIEGVNSVDNQLEVAEAAATDDAEADDAATDDAEADESGDAASGATVNELLDLEPITFEVSSANLTTEGRTVLDQAVAFFTENEDVSVEIGGHTDSDGSDATNLTLSQARAETVQAYLVENGIDAGRMTAVGYGEVNPIADNDTPENKAVNRRIEFTIQ